MTVATRNQSHGHSRHGTARCALGNVTNSTNSSNRSTTHTALRKATPKKAKLVEHKRIMSTAKTLFQDNSNSNTNGSTTTATNTTTNTTAATSSKDKIYSNVHWRSQAGLLKLTETTISFRTFQTKRLLWDHLESHSTKIVACSENPVLGKNKYLLKLKLKKPGCPPIVLRLSSQQDLDGIDYEITNTLRTRSVALFSRVYGKPEPQTAYYPIVKLCGSIPGSLTLESSHFIFEPLCSQRLPTIRICWSRVQQHQLQTRQTCLKIDCANSRQPIIFQLSSLNELKRCHHDFSAFVEWKRGGDENDNDMFRTPVKSNKKQKRVTFRSPVQVSKAIVEDSVATSSPKVASNAQTSLVSRLGKAIVALVRLVVMGLQLWAALEMVGTIGDVVVRLQSMQVLPPHGHGFTTKTADGAVARQIRIVTSAGHSSNIADLVKDGDKKSASSTKTSAPIIAAVVDTNDLVFQTLLEGMASWIDHSNASFQKN